jgi:hypothetical protein
MEDECCEAVWFRGRATGPNRTEGRQRHLSAQDMGKDRTEHDSAVHLAHALARMERSASRYPQVIPRGSSGRQDSEIC